MYGLHILCFRHIFFICDAYSFDGLSMYLSPVAAAAADAIPRWLEGPWKIIAKLNIFRQKCKIFLCISEKTSVAANRRVWPLFLSLSLLV